MSLSNKPNKSKYQVGETAYVLNGLSISSGKIIKVSSSVSNPLNDTVGLQENLYTIEGFVQPFREKDVFYSKDALLFRIKGGYLNKWTEGLFAFPIGIGSNLSFSDFTGANFNADGGLLTLGTVDFNEVTLDGCNFTNAVLAGCELSNCKMRDCILTGASITNANFYGVDLTGAVLDSTFDTKAEFKTKVGNDNWNEVIWIDGTLVT
ncbi:MAG: pentapeptide repeat-containing protein [Bacteroidetes bacterium]|nr:pentapeptide repeat-containing protein [Bacteroidota bacterium]